MYLSSVLVHSLLLPIQASDHGISVVTPTLGRIKTEEERSNETLHYCCNYKIIYHNKLRGDLRKKKQTNVKISALLLKIKNKEKLERNRW